MCVKLNLSWIYNKLMWLESRLYKRRVCYHRDSGLMNHTPIILDSVMQSFTLPIYILSRFIIVSIVNLLLNTQTFLPSDTSLSYICIYLISIVKKPLDSIQSPIIILFHYFHQTIQLNPELPRPKSKPFLSLSSYRFTV